MSYSKTFRSESLLYLMRTNVCDRYSLKRNMYQSKIPNRCLSHRVHSTLNLLLY